MGYIVLILCIAAAGAFMAGPVAKNKKLKKAIYELDENCDPYEYIRMLEEIPQRKKSNLMLYNKSVGYSCMNKWEEALKLLEDVDIKSLKRLGMIYRAYIKLRMNILYELGRVNEAELLKIDLIESEIICIIKKDERGILSDKIHLVEEFEREGKHEKMLELLKYEIQSGKSKRAWVSVNFIRGKAFKALGDYKNALKELEYVVQEGNKLHIVREAKDLIQEIEGGAL